MVPPVFLLVQIAFWSLTTGLEGLSPVGEGSSAGHLAALGQT